MLCFVGSPAAAAVPNHTQPPLTRRVHARTVPPPSSTRQKQVWTIKREPGLHGANINHLPDQELMHSIAGHLWHAAVGADGIFEAAEAAEAEALEPAAGPGVAPTGWALAWMNAYMGHGAMGFAGDSDDEM